MRPCGFRQVAEDGRIFCQKIRVGEREVTPGVCRTCPVAGIGCEHLRFTLEQVEAKRLVVRYGNGREEVWDDGPARVEFVQAACAAKVMPISGAGDCRGCAMRRCGGQEVVGAPPPEPRLVKKRPAVAAAPRPRRAPQRGRVIPFPGTRVATG